MSKKQFKIYLKDVIEESDGFPGEKILQCIDYKGEKHAGFFQKDYLKNGMLEVCIWNSIMCANNPYKDIIEVVPQGGEFINHGNLIPVYRSQLYFEEVN
jgi:hypothetical protein